MRVLLCVAWQDDDIEHLSRCFNPTSSAKHVLLLSCPSDNFFG